jgi:WD40 repeat protein
MIASGSGDSTIKLWNKNTGGLLITLRGHGSKVYSVAFDNNNMLASGSDDSTIKLWSSNDSLQVNLYNKYIVYISYI